ncbi:DUF6303 family protein [Streptomyces sp. NPDC003077]|uniref:DUF6303 family protein n=1 Tax=Streptomyces sp. NPDC003077 TaxID=3154443 RepID=UPI0033B37F52
MAQITYLAQLTSADGHRWRLFVAHLSNPAEAWPEHAWGHDTAVPTPPEREQALARLGYEVAPDDEWTWVEYSQVPGNPHSPVRLVAGIAVRPLAAARTAVAA